MARKTTPQTRNRRTDAPSTGDARQDAIRLLPSPADVSPDAAARQAILEQRLEDGYQRIERAIRSGEDVQRWEEFWMGLLHEYEALCDRLERAA